MRPKSRFCRHASAAILHAGRGDFSQLATAVVVATIGIKRSVADERGRTKAWFVLRKEQVRMIRHDGRAQRRPSRLLPELLPNCHGIADALKVKIAGLST